MCFLLPGIAGSKRNKRTRQAIACPCNDGKYRHDMILFVFSEHFINYSTIWYKLQLSLINTILSNISPNIDILTYILYGPLQSLPGFMKS